MSEVPLSGPIVVAGDITVDWLTWTHQEAIPALNLDEDNHNWRQHQITRRVARAGGAMLLARMLTHLLPSRDIVARYDPRVWQPRDATNVIESFAELTLHEKDKRFEIARLRGFGGPRTDDFGVNVIPFVHKKPSVLVLDDAGNGFRKLGPPAVRRWDGWLNTWTPEWIVLKHARPLGRAGDNGLWDQLRPRKLPPAAAPLIPPDRLVVVVNADDLRAHGIKLTPRLSWERTTEDFVRHIGSNGKLVTLTNCHNLLIRFGNEAVIHYRFDRRGESSLYYDPRRSEGDLVANAKGGSMIGLTAAFTAAIAADIAERGTFDANKAIRRAMKASAALATHGFRYCQQDLARARDITPDYDLPEIFAPARDDVETFRVTIPSAQISGPSPRPWRILENRGDTSELARQVVLLGVEAALGAPVAQYGDLVTADRREIEAVRAIRNLLEEYIDTPTMKKPHSIAVFGPPGSGKSFTVKEIAKTLLPDSGKRPPLEFNLSQFTGLPHLTGAFRLIQDRIIATEIPLVFFDEFDTSLGKEALGWLKYFLAPMQDAEFRDGEVTHPLGRAIFVFAGGTRTSFAKFSEPLNHAEGDKRREDFVAAKGPDFLSRLRGHVDIMGVAALDGGNDYSWPVRRAIPLRFMLRRRARALFGPKGDLAIDDGVLHAFLTVPNFRHGSRSIEAILDMCTLTHARRFTSSCLPTRDQLALHVDVDAFMDRVTSERLPEPLCGNLAIRIHDAYRAMRRVKARGDPAKLRALANDASMVGWSDLSAALRDSNRQQANAIPGRLRCLKLYLAEYDPARANQEVRRLPPGEIDLLAEMEHERFVAERLTAGWRSGPRDSRNATTPFLVPWSDVDEEYKDYDRATIRIIPELLHAVGYRIFRMPTIE